ncbi:NAD(P)/FAD-dependent oxidoreductase [Pedobacter sp. SL55]|uniref:NAD(P)/FAD-dependent oxidoreductase n=1 Tax=Pedobacter sp. SL55 TaxID=2995161 RepID=UPI002270FDC8|nr:FAD-binding oxidoreductase [Pedobacter sp. SL55]WAC41788.1 FAD-binding oxidoreductase [Pedobacter sp. SL55]
MQATNLSYWEKANFYRSDVLIVGSGIVGLNAAIIIKKQQPNLSVSILERGFLPSGASTKNAGFACFGSLSELVEQEKICGTNALHQLIGKRWKGLQKLRSMVGDTKLDLQINGGFELFKPQDFTLSEKCVSKISHFNELIKDITSNDSVFNTAHQQINSFGFDGIDCLIENKLEAQLDPGKMIKALVEIASSLGVVILSNCTVNQFEQEENRILVATSQGNFKTKKLLFCTNAFANQLIPDLQLKPGRGQVLITKPIENLKLKGTFHYDKGYYYFRNVGNRVLLGGGRNLDFFTEETHQFGETPLVQNTLLRLLKEVILPYTAFEIEQKWSGIMAFGPELSPIIEEVKPNVFCAVRCNGMGIAIGSQTGEEAGEMVLRSF